MDETSWAYNVHCAVLSSWAWGSVIKFPFFSFAFFITLGIVLFHSLTLATLNGQFVLFITTVKRKKLYLELFLFPCENRK